MYEGLRILLLDDNPDDRVLVIRGLKRDFEDLRVDQVIDMEDFEHVLERFDYDLVITDYQLHWSNGLHILRAIKEGWPRCPVIMFTATGTEEVAVQAMKSGLDDYILKSAKHFSRLPATVKKVLDSAGERLSREMAESRYQELFESLPVGLYEVARDGVITETNNALSELLGYQEKEKLLEMSMDDLYVDPESRHRWRALMENEGVVNRFEARLYRRDGSIIWVQDTCRAIHDGEGGVIRYEGSMEDITDRRRAEDDLRESEERYRELAESITDIFFAMDRELRYTYWNKASEELLGIAAREALGRTIYEVFPGKEVERAVGFYLEVLRKRKPDTLITEFPISGKIFTFEINAYPTEGGLAVFVKDITERLGILSRLERLNRCFLGMVVSPVANIFKIVRESREIMDAYAVRYCRMEHDRLSIISTLRESRVFEFPQDPRGYIYFNLIEEDEDIVVYEDLAKTPYGQSDTDVRTHGLRAYAAHLVRLEGEPVGCLEVFENERREYSAADLDILGMLARALSIEEERRSHDEALKDFVDIASHELRHPVTIVKGYAQTLRELEHQMDEATRKEVLQSIERGADRLNDLVLELLDVSRIERGRFVVEKELVELGPIIEGTMAEISEKGYMNEFNLEMRDEPGERWVDEEKIGQLLIILMDNAANYSKPGSKIKVKVEVGDDGVVVSVMDRGQGISDEEQEAVFERFYQVEDALHHSSPGIGLGLYIAREIAEAHGGNVWHEHREGGGSIFRFIIP
ncbi:MAG: PAS domain S-box protein [Actinomycetota bacterium]|nr:PAS domain S-box protein [Actinomycetota bacterium]